jgi:hypothetical protein
MFCIIDFEKNCIPIKSGFKTASKANNWAKKNLPKDEVHLFGEKVNRNNKYTRYGVVMR